MKVVLVLAVLGLVGCSKSTSAAAEKTYTLFWNAEKTQPPGGLRVTAMIPGGWKADLNPMGQPTFLLGSGQVPRVSIVAITPGGDDKARMTSAIELQFDAADLASAKREDKPDGRVWIEHRKPDSIHARMFLLAPDSVVMCVIFMMDDTSQFAAAAAACDSVRVK